MCDVFIDECACLCFEAERYVEVFLCRNPNRKIDKWRVCIFITFKLVQVHTQLFKMNRTTKHTGTKRGKVET